MYIEFSENSRIFFCSLLLKCAIIVKTEMGGIR